MKDRPIGIFDSGVGGLTVFDAISRAYPSESLVYFGDTGRYPYGVRSKGVIVEFSRQIAGFLEDQGCKFIVLACNSASALALEEVASSASVEVIGVIEPGAAAAVAATLSGRVGVIGTEATINSDAYTRALQNLAPRIDVIARPCPLFVALAEEGFAGKPATRSVAEEYLAPFKDDGIDTLVLGCTHYPLLKRDIAAVMGPSVQLVDSATAVAHAVGSRLEERNHHRRSDAHGEYKFYVSDTPGRFQTVGRRFLGREVAPVEVVDLETLHEFGELARTGRRV
ncbi:MAG: glutamate racemase [candidate division Zixibacteria bacterium]|nr:glutamate racemase [candidate division Zixibacteria bacterium]